MPTYAYRGSECSHEFEMRQSFAEDPATECVECGKPVHRVIHPAGIVFKGTGWYITDSRPTADPVGGVKDASKANGKKDDASESKPASEKKPEPAAATASAAGKDD